MKTYPSTHHTSSPFLLLFFSLCSFQCSICVLIARRLSEKSVQIGPILHALWNRKRETAENDFAAAI